MRTEDGQWGVDRWIASDNLTSLGFQHLIRMLAVFMLRATVKDGHLLSFIDWRQLPILQGCVESAGWSPRSLLVWDKKYPGMGNGFRQQVEFCLHASKGIGDNFARRDVGTYWRAPEFADAEVLHESRPSGVAHPTPKPVGAVLTWLSCLPRGIVCDPFCGSGNMLIAALEAGHRVIGADNSEEFVELTRQRTAQVSMLTPAPVINEPDPTLPTLFPFEDAGQETTP